jgi:hypothetical protein
VRLSAETLCDVIDDFERNFCRDKRKSIKRSGTSLINLCYIPNVNQQS